MLKYFRSEIVKNSFLRLAFRQQEGKTPMERTSSIFYFLAFDAVSKQKGNNRLDFNPNSVTGSENRKSLEAEFTKLVLIERGNDSIKQVCELGKITSDNREPGKRISSNFLTVALKNAAQQQEPYTYPKRPPYPLLKLGDKATGIQWGIQLHDDWKENLPHFFDGVSSNTPFTDLAIFVSRNTPLNNLSIEDHVTGLSMALSGIFSVTVFEFWMDKIYYESRMVEIGTSVFGDFYEVLEMDVSEASAPENENPETFGEPEDKGSSPIIHPFDPTKIDIRPQPLTIVSILRRLQSSPSRINLQTQFQRKGDLWEVEKQSRLIESLLVRIPLPAFYFDGTSDNWLIVDGLQRIGTLKNFIIDTNFKLKGLEYLQNFEGYGWNDLPPYLQTRIEETPITAYIINPGTPEEVKFNIFKRINTGGLVLAPQEIRHALNQGIPADFIMELANEPAFLTAMGGKVPTDRMEDRDYVTRFVSFYFNSDNYQPDLDSFLNQNMGKLKMLTDAQRQNVKQKFIFSQKIAHRIFGEYAFRKRLKKNDRKKPINKALFECVSVSIAKLTEAEAELLVSKKNLVEDALIELLNNDSNFFKAITASTGDSSAVERRHNGIRNLFNHLLHD